MTRELNQPITTIHPTCLQRTQQWTRTIKCYLSKSLLKGTTNTVFPARSMTLVTRMVALSNNKENQGHTSQLPFLEPPTQSSMVSLVILRGISVQMLPLKLRSGKLTLILKVNFKRLDKNSSRSNGNKLLSWIENSRAIKLSNNGLVSAKLTANITSF